MKKSLLIIKKELKKTMKQNDKYQKKLSFANTIKSILWAFFGVRKHTEYEKEQAHFNPFYVIFGAIFLVAIFILILLIIINFVIHKS